jgi:hypothetical protein
MPHAVNIRLQYNVEVDWKTLPPHTNTLAGITPDVESLRFRREKNSHLGISKFTRLRRLVAFCVNQDCLEEIAELPNLQFLYVSEMTAANLDCLGRCRTLRHLTLKGGTKVPSLSWLSSLPPLDSLLLEHFKQVTDLSAIGVLPSLKAFGIEGSMWTTQKVDSFRPIALLPQLEALFLTNCRPIAEGLEPLKQLHRLRYLEIAAFYPDADFLALRHALPSLECDWFPLIDKYGSTKAAIKARTKG